MVVPAHTGNSTAGLAAITDPYVSQRRADDVVEWLHSAIVNGELQPGERFTESQVCEQIRLSRSPVREAILVLTDIGVLQRDRRGIRVADVDAGVAANLYDCRLLLEPECARLATPYIDATVLTAAEAAMECMVRAQRDHAFADWLREVENFHSAYRSACPNSELAGLVNRMAARCIQLRAIGISRQGRLADSQREHQLLLDALRAGDPFDHLVTALLHSARRGIVASLTT